jgi:predicted amidohydrolase
MSDLVAEWIVKDDLCRLSREAAVWMGIGLLERSGERLYDTAILIDPGGEIRLQHRRIQPQWHGRRADPRVYCEGSEITTCQTP